jgi:hypothetical protein
LELTSDGVRFVAPDLKPGTYIVRVTRDGFEPRTETVNLKDSVDLALALAIARQQTNITVPGQALAYANSDPVYRKLRGVGLGDTFRFDNFT